MASFSTESTNVRKAVVALAFIVVVWRAATLPVTPAEALAWDRVVRPPFALLLVTPGDWSGLLYGLIARRAAGLFRLSEFSLRFPGILGCALYLYSVYRLCGKSTWVLAALSIPAIFLNWFNLATGTGLSIGLTALALAHPPLAGVALGLALVAEPRIGFVPAFAACLLAWRIGIEPTLERVVIPAIAIGFVSLIVALSHGGAPLQPGGSPNRRDAAVRAAVDVLRRETGQGTVAVAASPSAVPLLAFYRARYRQRNWVDRGPQPSYFLQVAPDLPLPSGYRHILFSSEGVVLAR